MSFSFFFFGERREERGGGGLPDVEESRTAESVVTPLVGAVNESTDQTGDDDKDRHEQGRHDVREGQAGAEENLQDQQREGDEPLDVPHVLPKKKEIRPKGGCVEKKRIRTQIWRVAPSARNSAEMGVAPRSEAMEK